MKKSKLNSVIEIFNCRGIKVLLIAILNFLHLIFIRDILKKKLIIKKVNDYKMNLFTNDKGISRSLILFGTREEDKKYILKKVLKKKMKIFDIGSNIGYYTIFFSKYSCESKILAIEPSIENLNLCKKNLLLNEIDFKKIQLLNAGASNKNTTKDFFIASQSNLHTFNPNGSAKNFLSGQVLKINTYSIFNLSKKFFKPDLIRMDVEGHECEIISGMLKYIKNGFFKPHICFEPHIGSYNVSNNFSDTLSKIFKLGYYTKLISSNAENGTDRISDLTKVKPFFTVTSDGEMRGIFKNLNNKDTIKILTEIGGARTVLLSPKNI